MDERIALALRSEKIADIPIEKLVGQVTTMLASVYMLTGFSAPSSKDLGVLAAKITSDLKQYHGGLSVQEVSLCFENGSKDEYGDFMGINVRTITKWLKAYKTSGKRYKTIVELEKGKEALPPPSKDYDEQVYRRICLRYFEKYKKKENPPLFCPGRMYQFLQGKGIINHSLEMKMDALEKAKSHLKASRSALSTADFEVRAKLEAQTELLHTFFRELVERGIELEDMFLTN